MKNICKRYIRLHFFLIINILTEISLFPKSIDQINPDTKDSIKHLLEKANQYINSGDFYQASKLIRESHNLKLSLYRNNSKEIASSYTNLALSYWYMWEFDSALHYINKAELIFLNHRNEVDLGYLYAITGNIFYKRGELELAEKYYLKAEQNLSNSYNKFYINIKIVLYIWLGELEKERGNLPESIHYYNKCNNSMGSEINQNNFKINYLIGVSAVNKLQGNTSKSISLLKEAINICKKDSIAYAWELITLYNNIAQTFLLERKYLLAEKHFTQALYNSSKANLKGVYRAEIYTGLAEIEFNLSHFDMALENVQVALAYLSSNNILSNSLSNPRLEEITAQLLALNTLKLKIKYLQSLFQVNKNLKYLDAAIATSQLAIEIISDLRNSYQTYESKLSLAEHEDDIYKIGLNLCNLAYQQTKQPKYFEYAFTLSEKNKSSVLLSSLRELSAKSFGEIPNDLINREKTLSKNITFYKEMIYEEEQNIEPDPVKLKTWENYLFNVQREHEKLISRFEKEYPNYYALKYDNSVISSSELQKHLSKNTTVLEYFLSDTSIYTFVIDKEHLYLHTQPIDSSFNYLLLNFLREYKLFDFSKQSQGSFEEYCKTNKRVYDILIGPVASRIRGDNLLIVPDGILSYIPFETLIANSPEAGSGVNYRGLNYLLRKYAIAYSYSSTIFCQIDDKGGNKRNKKLLAFAPEYGTMTNANLEEPHLVTRQKYRKDLQPIPGAIDEVNLLKKLLPADVFIGNEATESNFKNLAGIYDILHLAMHTVIDNHNPMYSKLIFSPTDDSLNDGFLNTYELFSMKLKAKMVVLSACSTGEGDYSKGEGVMSLARGFVYAGSPCLVMTLWEVEDKSGITIMNYFYENLLKGQSKEEALRNAKLSFLNEAKIENSHPFFWSSYVIMGNPKAIFRNKWLTIMPYAGAALVLLFLLVLFRFRSKNIKSVGLSRASDNPGPF